MPHRSIPGCECCQKLRLELRGKCRRLLQLHRISALFHMSLWKVGANATFTCLKLTANRRVQPINFFIIECLAEVLPMFMCDTANQVKFKQCLCFVVANYAADAQLRFAQIYLSKPWAIRPNQERTFPILSRNQGQGNATIGHPVCERAALEKTF